MTEYDGSFATKKKQASVAEQEESFTEESIPSESKMVKSDEQQATPPE